MGGLEKGAAGKQATSSAQPCGQRGTFALHPLYSEQPLKGCLQSSDASCFQKTTPVVMWIRDWRRERRKWEHSLASACMAGERWLW